MAHLLCKSRDFTFSFRSSIVITPQSICPCVCVFCCVRASTIYVGLQFWRAYNERSYMFMHHRKCKNNLMRLVFFQSKSYTWRMRHTTPQKHTMRIATQCQIAIIMFVHMISRTYIFDSLYALSRLRKRILYCVFRVIVSLYSLFVHCATFWHWSASRGYRVGHNKFFSWTEIIVRRRTHIYTQTQAPQSWQIARSD